MNVIILLLIAGVIIASIFIIAFIWAIQSGQFDDMTSPASRILFEDKIKKSKK